MFMVARDEHRPIQLYEMMARLGIEPSSSVLPQLSLRYAAAIQRCKACAYKQACRDWLDHSPVVVSVAPHFCPDAEIEGFRRLDTIAGIRELAKNWRNCLAGYLFSVNDGTSAIYLSEQLEAVCSVGRHGRMGWFLVQTKGPRNADIDPDQLAQIHAAFAAAGIPEAAMIDPIKSIIQTDKWSRQLGDQELVFDDIVLH
jgi:hypothetical protein